MMGRMRIALVVTGGFDSSGRQHVIPTLLALVERLSRRHEVFVYVLRYLAQPSTYRLLGVTVRDLGRPTGVRQQYGRLIAALKSDGPFDVLHAYWGIPAGLVTALAGRRSTCTTVVTCDSGEFVALPDIGYGSQLRIRQRLAMRATAQLGEPTHRVLRSIKRASPRRAAGRRVTNPARRGLLRIRPGAADRGSTVAAAACG